MGQQARRWALADDPARRQVGDTGSALRIVADHEDAAASGYHRRVPAARLRRLRLGHGLQQAHNKLASKRAVCTASRCAPSAIWLRQLVPSATTMASGCARTAGSSLASAIAIDTAWCFAS